MSHSHPSKTIVITGSSDGIGAAAARELTDRGHDVVVVGRNFRKTRDVAAALGARYHVADFADLGDVRNLAEELADLPRIDVLANNAGGSFSRGAVTSQGYDLTFQVNCLAPFLLTQLLLPQLIASSGSVIQTASIASRFCWYDAEAVEREAAALQKGATKAGSAPKGKDLLGGYGKAKFANIVYAREFQRRYAADGLAAVAFHPGVVATKFATQERGILGAMYRSPLRKAMVQAQRGADQLVWLADSTPGIDWTPGAYYENRKVPKVVNPQLKNDNLARALWDWCAEVTKCSNVNGPSKD